jgi:Xaa-Pro aminopeptidase
MMTPRLHNIREALKKKGLEKILVLDPVSARYISGFSASNIALLISRTAAWIFTDFRYITAAKTEIDHSLWTVVESADSLITSMAAYIEPDDSVGIESDVITLDNYTLLTKNSDARFIPFGREIKQFFMEKTADEADAVRRAAAIADQALQEWVPTLHYGISECDAARNLEKICAEKGSQRPSFETITLFGTRTALPHGTPQKDIFLTAGDTVLVDFGCTVDGFASDMTRTFFTRPATDSQKSLYEIVLSAQKRAKRMVKPGVTAREIDACARKTIEKSGYGNYFKHGTGHGVGLRVHEAPALGKKSKTVLRPGMIITVEPGIYIPETGGVRIEDLLLVTETGYESLSQSPRSLTSIL